MDHLNQVTIQFKQRLRAGECVVGAGLAIAHPISTKMMARAGFDYIMIDLEHLPMSPESLSLVLDQFRLSNTVPFVRVAWKDAVMAKQALDLGARGIVFPSVLSPSEAQEVVSYCFYPPRGIRGFGPHWATDFGLTRHEYAITAEEAIFVAVMIEHIEAVQQIDAIAAVEGVDGLMVGPSDLSGSMGQLIPQVTGSGETEDVRRAIERIISAGKRAGKPVFYTSAPQAGAISRQLERGFQALSIGSDYQFILNTARQAIETFQRNQPNS